MLSIWWTAIGFGSSRSSWKWPGHAVELRLPVHMDVLVVVVRPDGEGLRVDVIVHVQLALCGERVPEHARRLGVADV